MAGTGLNSKTLPDYPRGLRFLLAERFWRSIAAKTTAERCNGRRRASYPSGKAGARDPLWLGSRTASCERRSSRTGITGRPPPPDPRQRRRNQASRSGERHVPALEH